MEASLRVAASLQGGPYWWVDPTITNVISPDFDTAEEARGWWDGMREKLHSEAQLAVTAWAAGLDIDDLFVTARDHATLVCLIGADDTVPIEGFWYDPETKGWREEEE